MYLIKRGKYFYPRPPRGGRPAWVGFAATSSRFLSTPSARRATVRKSWRTSNPEISIHALREEGDSRDSSTITKKGDFYPRPPRGGRHCNKRYQKEVNNISIHALREEGDETAYASMTLDAEFLSTPSARRATSSVSQASQQAQISIHALREEGDSKNRDKISIFKQIIQHSARI